MSELLEQVCRILKRHFHCLCDVKPLYCACVVDLVNLILEKCEEETEEETEEAN